MNRFISFEGGEGVGKSSLIGKIAAWMHGLNIPFIQTREPGGTIVGEKIRDLFLYSGEDKLNLCSEALLINAARSEHCEKVIARALVLNKWVLCDRFVDSSYVYQGIIGGFDSVLLQQLINVATNNLYPGLTFLLDCEVQVSMQRIAGRNLDASNRFDQASIEFHEKLRNAYLEHAARNRGRIIVLDASLSAEKLTNLAIDIIRRRFNLD